MNQPQAKTIRAKKLGVLLRDARLAAGKTIKECAEVVGVPTSTFGAYERGVKSPSLPELEILAFFLDVPLEHFWGSEAISEKPSPVEHLDVDETLTARQTDIARAIQAARAAANVSLKELARRANLSPKTLKAYEMGERAIPLPDLEALNKALGRDIRDFMDQQGPVGEWNSEKEAVEKFLELSPDLKSFVCKPINRPYLELAQRLSEMPVEKLRAVAEGLLEITL